MKKILLCVISIFFMLTAQSVQSQNLLKMAAPLLDTGGSVIPPRDPVVVSKTPTGTDKIEIYWLEGSDGRTPLERVKYEIHLSDHEDFEPSELTLKKEVIGTAQAEIDGLNPGVTYYGKVVAYYRYTDTSSDADASNTGGLTARTWATEPVTREEASPVLASDLGLGLPTIGEDGTTYTFSGGTAPAAGNTLFSGDAETGITLRTVESATVNPDGTITVTTSDAALSDVIEEGELYSSLQLVELEDDEPMSTPRTFKTSGTLRTGSTTENSSSKRVRWKNRRLDIKQTNYTYEEEDFSLTPQGNDTFLMRMSAAAEEDAGETDVSMDQSFSARVSGRFTPGFKSSASIGWVRDGIKIYPKLKSADFYVSGDLYMEAVAQYNFTGSASIEKEKELVKRTYTSVYFVGPWPVYQEVTLTLSGKFEAEASAKIDAKAMGSVSKFIKVGVRFDGSKWSPYPSNDPATTDSELTLEAVGEASATVRIIPKVEIKYYGVAGGYLTAEPFLQANIGAETVTSQVLIQADLLGQGLSPIHLTDLDFSIGLECNVGLTMPSIIEDLGGDTFEPKCVLGTEDHCLLTPFGRFYLLKIPEIEMNMISPDTVQLTAKDGKLISVPPASVNWNIYHNATGTDRQGADIIPGPCTQSGSETTCTAKLKLGAQSKENYTIYAASNKYMGGHPIELLTNLYGKLTPPPYSAKTTVDAGNGHTWGDWHTLECPNGHYVTGFSQQLEPDQKDGDDTALNNVRLRCSDGGPDRELTPQANWGKWGTWGNTVTCPSGSYLSGFSLKSEGYQGSGGDDTGANSIKGYCSQNGNVVSTIEPSNIGPWGYYDTARYCPAGSLVCGAKLRIEPDQGGGDDTALSNASIICCPM